MLASLFYAFGLGSLGALNPCGFPLLPAYLSLFTGSHDAALTTRVRNALIAALCISSGFVIVFGFFGILAELGIQLLSGWIPYLMIPMGLALALAGMFTLFGKPLKLPALNRAHHIRRSVPSMFLFGVSYALASLSCALPVFIAGDAGTFVRQGAIDGIACFIAYAMGMGMLFGVSALLVAIAGAGSRTLQHLRHASRATPTISAGVLVLVGAYLAYYWTYALVDPLATPVAVRVVERTQATFSSWLSAHLGYPCAALAAVMFTFSARRLLSPPKRGRIHDVTSG